MNARLLFVLAGLASILVSCSAGEADKLPPGRCVISGDCPASETCRNTYCEDIYYPRKDIKPY